MLSSFSRLLCGAILGAIVWTSLKDLKTAWSLWGDIMFLGGWMQDYLNWMGWDEGARCERSMKVALTFAFSLSSSVGAWTRPSHEPNRCGPLSVPRPGCHGSRSVILCQRFSPASTGSGLACALPSVYPSSCQHGWILAKNSQQLMMSRTDKGICFH